MSTTWTNRITIEGPDVQKLLHEQLGYGTTENLQTKVYIHFLNGPFVSPEDCIYGHTPEEVLKSVLELNKDESLFPSLHAQRTASRNH